MNFKKWFVSFALQGASISLFNIVISLYIVLALKGNVQSASIAVAFFSLGNLIGSISSSIILDKVKRVSAIIYSSFFISSTLIILMAFVKSILLYYILAMALGSIISFTGPAMTLQLSKAGDDGFVRRQINNLNLFNSVGSTIGMLFGSFLLTAIKSLNDITKLRVVFLISSILLLISSLLTLEKRKLVLRVTPDIRATKILFLRIAKFSWEFIRVMDIRKLDNFMKSIVAAVFVVFFGANLVFSVFTVFLKEYFKVSSQFVFLLYSLNSLFGNIAFVIVGLIKTKKYDRFFINAVLVLRGILFILIGLFVLLKLEFMRSFAYVSFVFFGFTWPFFYIPLTLEITKQSPHHLRGRALGIFNMSINFAVIMASFVAGFISLHFGYAFTFIIGGIFLFIGFVIFKTRLT